jgi:hypothetical protein
MDEQTDLYLTTHNNDKRQTSTSSEGFEPTIPAGDRPQTHALDRAAAVISSVLLRWGTSKYVSHGFPMLPAAFSCITSRALSQ